MPDWLQAAGGLLAAVAGGVLTALWRYSKLESKVAALCREVAAYKAYLAPEKVAARAEERTEDKMVLRQLVESHSALKREFRKDRDKQWTQIDGLRGAKGDGDDD